MPATLGVRRLRPLGGRPASLFVARLPAIGHATLRSVEPGHPGSRGLEDCGRAMRATLSRMAAGEPPEPPEAPTRTSAAPDHVRFFARRSADSLSGWARP